MTAPVSAAPPMSWRATWRSRDKERVARGAINFGDFEQDIRPSGDRAAFGGAEECQISLRLLGPYLLARDTGNCGGLNVSFTGVYRR